MDKKLSTMTVGELREALCGVEDDIRVRVWLPGSTIALRAPIERLGELHIEGNIDPGSALCD